MKKNKGFTLIELLAVIVILAIIALIATPTILGVIEKAKKGSAESSALGFVDAVEKQIAINTLDSSKTDIIDGAYYTDDLMGSTYGVTIKGTAPTNDGDKKSWVQVSRNQVVNYSLKIGDYIVNYNPTTTTAEAVKASAEKTLEEKPNDESGNIPIPSEPSYGVTMEVAGLNDTHKGIVYLDPTDLTKSCNASNSVSTTETKTGCMKWYIYDDSGDNYKLILDHNTTARIKWNDDNINVAYETSNLYAVVQDLKTTSKWVVNPDLITAEEVNSITGKTGFDTSNTSSWYYLDTKTQTKADFTSARSKYDWLYNNLNKCKTDSPDCGCSIEDGNTYQGYGTAGEGQTWVYWTKTTVGSAGSSSRVWDVSRAGLLSYGNANSANFGLRPVITVSKNIFQK